MRVRHRHEVLFAPGQQRERCGALQDGGGRVAVELGLGQDGGSDGEALLTVGHEEG